jgi:quercetin dioxygenase-like cupin family protein
VTIEETRVELGEGDALYFESEAPHSYGGMAPDGASALVVVTAGGGARA